MPNDRAVVYWFTYAADGSGEQAWMMGDGQFQILGPPPPPGGDEQYLLSINPIWQPVGATYGPSFNPEDVEHTDWGDLLIVFHDQNSAHVDFDSNLDEFGTGDFPIERLARPMLAECD